jgi:NADPH:quinone reductase-like Zn-dependent oxidoreductase
VQMARNHFGANVTGVCSSGNMSLVKSLGADAVLDYTQEDFSRHGPIYDVVFDAVARFSPARARTALKPGGTYLNVHEHSGGRSGQTMLQELLSLKELLESGKVRPVIDRCYPLEQIVEAHRYVNQGHKKGNVGVWVAQEAAGQ